MIPESALFELATLGLSKDQAAAVARMLREVETATKDELSAPIEARRKADRDRQARLRDKKNNVTSRDVTLGNVTERDSDPAYKDNHARAPVNRDPPSEDISIITPLPTVGTPKKSSVTKEPNAHEILIECLSDQTARDLIAHRKAKRSPMTPRAAQLLVDAFVAYGSPEKAAQEMISRGWTGFKPDWMREDARAGPGPPRPEKRNTTFQAGLELMEEYRREAERNQVDQGSFTDAESSGQIIELAADAYRETE